MTGSEPKARVLVADDDPVDRLLAEEVLAGEGFGVEAAADGVEAWERCVRRMPDLVVLDLLMPRMDGFEVLRRLREEPWGRDVPVLVLTSLDDLDSIARAYGLGATDFATKPANWIVLAQRLRYMLRASRIARDLADAQRVARLGSWVLAPDTGRMAWSEELRRMVGRPEETARSFLEAVPDEDRPRVLALWDTAGSGGEADPVDHALVRPDGTRLWVRHRAVGGPGGGVRGTVQDITRETELERRLRQVEKLEALGTLAGGIAHDFNNLLVPIIGFTDLALAQLPPESTAREGLELVASTARRARDLVRRILAFSRGAEGPRGPVSLRKVVSEVGAVLAGSLPPGVRWVEEVEVEDLRVEGDPAGLHQVLLNLCQNAVHALGEKGGEVRIRAGRRPAPGGGEEVCIEVADTGCGMPPGVRERAFEPFFTTKPVGQGTGLGLSVVHGVVKGMGGRVEVESTPGGGSTFRVFLPPCPDGAAPEPVPPGRRVGVLSILLVDDEVALLRYGLVVLERAGHRVDACADPREALERIRREPHRYDLVMADRSMPGMCGDAFLSAARELRPDLRTILCTGGGAGTGRIAAADRVVLKPLTPDEILAVVEEVMAHGRGS